MEIYIVIALLIIIIVLIFIKNKPGDQSDKMIEKLGELNSSIKEELRLFREETSRSARENREELLSNFEKFSENASNIIAEFGNKQDKRIVELKDNMEKLREKNEEKFESLKESISKNLESLTEKNEEKIGTLQLKIESNLKEINEDNTKQLDKMRETVDEKLQKTLQERISNSFKLVSERLEQVHKGLGEMQTLATGVGDLKKVLNNVKSKGILGEYQLENLLESMLAPGQYDKQISVAPNSSKIVDFAVKLPGKSEGSNIILPIDSKFPSEYYFGLTEAYEKGETELVETKRKELTAAVKKMAKDISEKYIEPPYTTDFALMFLPLEGLFAEVLRDPDLFDVLQRDYKVIITGPTTLSALLNSFQMGFRTLALEKKSAHIDTILQGVKSEFGKFGGILEKANKNIAQAGKNLEDLIGTRTRAIQRKLKDVEIDTEEDYSKLISDGDQLDLLDEENDQAPLE